MDQSHRSDQEERRHEELEELERLGVDAYPYSWPVTHHADAVLASFDDDLPPFSVAMAGRVMAKRVMGKASFFQVQDSTGRIQAYVTRDDLPEGYYNDVFKRLLDIGDLVGIEGYVFRTKTGEISIRVERMALLAKALRPLPVEKEADGRAFNVVADKEFRYRQRYVDLALHEEVRKVFIQRAKIVSTIRRFLDERGYVEVETPILQPLYGGASARPFTTHHNALDTTLYLRIADELYLKRLIVGGFEGVYEISKDFRNEGLSRFHNPEFTMMELYVAYKDYLWMMDLVEELVECLVLELHGTTEVVTGGRTISFARPWRRVAMFDAIRDATGMELRGLDRNAVADAATAHGMVIDSTMGTGKIIDEIFGEYVEPDLIQPTFVMDYPVELSPLAKKHRTEEGLVERFEAICNGKEICNAFSELNDPRDQRARLAEQSRLRAGGDEEAMPIDEDYIRALEYGMPPTAGLGLGIDRLTMILTDQSSIRDVILFPLLRPEVETESADVEGDGES